MSRWAPLDPEIAREHTRERLRTWFAAKYRRLRTEGRCVRCKTPGQTQSYCEACKKTRPVRPPHYQDKVEKARARNKRLYQQNVRLRALVFKLYDRMKLLELDLKL